VQFQHCLHCCHKDGNIGAGVSDEFGVRNPARGAWALAASVVHVDFIPRAIVEAV
jgi:hypothetical protein